MSRVNQMAQRIVKDFGPKTLLCVGRDAESIADVFKDLGVAAYAVLDSETKSLPKNFPAEYDMVLTMELLERLSGMAEQLETYQTHYHAAISQRDALASQLGEAQGMYQTVVNSGCWKVTKPIRMVLDPVKRTLRNNPRVRAACKDLKSVVKEGPVEAGRKIKLREANKDAEPALLALLTEPECEAQRKTVFAQNIKFSILVPLYNTPETFLREMILSVCNQTYANWELCLADGSDGEHGDVERICRAYSKMDRRIKYKKLEKNMGISGNTNACIEMAGGDYISLFDHDDLLHPSVLYEVMHAICDKGADFVYTDECTFHETISDAYFFHFKPDYAPDTLRANNYICHFTTFKRELLDKTGGFNAECDGSQDFDLFLRLTEQAKNIVHIPKNLYYWRAHKTSVAQDVSAKPYVVESAHRAIQGHLKRVGLEGEVLNTVVPSMYRIKYAIKGNPLISILIPNKDHIEDLEKCLNSIREKSTYENYEIIVIENNSVDAETFAYYKTLEGDPRIQVVTWKGIFNYSAINNFGFRFSKGEYILLLNNDMEIISPDWLQEMLMYVQRKDVGAAGAKLYYPDNTIQHAGIGIGLLTLAGHYHKNFEGNHPGYMGRLIYAHNVSAVTGACMMIRRDVYEEVNGLDETFEVAFNDVDICMRIRERGYLIVWTPFAELYHYESKSRGLDDAPEKRARFVGEVTRFQKRWRVQLDQGDPYYNPNFTLDREDFSIK